MPIIEIYKTQSGGCPLLDAIKELDPEHQSQIMNSLKNLEKYGLGLLATKNAKKIKGHNKLYELRVDYKRINHRIFFTIDRLNIYWVMNYFKKKSNKTPLKELNHAENIKRTILN